MAFHRRDEILFLLLEQPRPDLDICIMFADTVKMISNAFTDITYSNTSLSQ